MTRINKICFIGMGLINSSLARTLKRKKFYKISVGNSRSNETLSIVKKLNIVDFIESDCKEAVKEADLVVIGIPVKAYQGVLKKISNHLKPGCIITDVGSVKLSLVKSFNNFIPKNVFVVPGHPIAGTEKSGPEAGFDGLFEKGWCILTPDPKLNIEKVNIVKEMWEVVGMKVDIMSPSYHDMVLAITSHIPHIIAYSIVGTVSNLENSLKKEVVKYAASGFKDFTRIAASDPTMWRDIMLLNKRAILNMLTIFKKDLASLEKAIENEDADFMYKLFSETRKIRKDIIN